MVRYQESTSTAKETACVLMIGAVGDRAMTGDLLPLNDTRWMSPSRDTPLVLGRPFQTSYTQKGATNHQYFTAIST